MPPLLLEEFRITFDEYLERRLRTITLKQALGDLVGYTPRSGGKRLRPYIIYLFSNILEIPEEVYLELGLAVELFHSGSLIQDDLPSLDNDNFRRGKPSLHRLCGDGPAMLVADYLMLYPGKIILTLPLSAEIKLNLLRLWHDTSLKVIEGEFLDINTRVKSVEEVERIHYLKTAAFFGFCFSSPFICAGKQTEAVEMEKAGIDFGMAFQIFDDIKDKYGKSEILGKTPGKDEIQNRPNILRYMEMERAKKTAEKFYSKALERIKQDEIKQILDRLRKLVQER